MSDWLYIILEFLDLAVYYLHRCYFSLTIIAFASMEANVIGNSKRKATNVVVNIDAQSLISLASTRREIDTLSTPLGKHFGEICGLDSWRIQIIGKIYSFSYMVGTVPWWHLHFAVCPCLLLLYR